MDIIEAANLNNEAIALEAAGDYDGAEKKHLLALELKRNSACAKPHITAITENGLRELYLKMGKLDQAEKLLRSAYCGRNSKCLSISLSLSMLHQNRIRIQFSIFVLDAFSDFDRSCTADNLGRLYEMRGDIPKARKWRTANAPKRMICSNFDVCYLVTDTLRYLSLKLPSFYSNSLTVSKVNGLATLYDW